MGCDGPTLTATDSDKIDTLRDPEQFPVTSVEPAVVTLGQGSLTITPVAAYKISGVVVSRESYDDGWESKLSPVDLAMVWGNLAEPEYDKYVTYSQRSRWYFYRYKAGTPLDVSYIRIHSANNHIIPASDNVKKAVKTLREKDKVVLEGFLVNVAGTYEGRSVSWNTSLSRTDTGNGSCEILYVTRLKVDCRVYE